MVDHLKSKSINDTISLSVKVCQIQLKNLDTISVIAFNNINMGKAW